MNNFKTSAISHRMREVVTRSLGAVGFSLAISTLSIPTFAACQYVIQDQWGSGFNAKIKVTNDGTNPINGWAVNWQYSGDNRITNSYNAALTGTNPYTATNLNWNSTIQPGQYIEFGFQGSKGAASAEIPVVAGTACGSTTSSSSRSSSSVATSSSSSSISSSRSSISSSPSSISSSRSSSSVTTSSSSSVATAAWNLNTTDSSLNFVSTKNSHVVEVHNFTTFSGNISTSGVATLIIDLSSVNTGVTLRDQRMRDLLFETATYPTATVSVTLPSTLLSSLSVGQTAPTDITASLSLHGVTGTITTKVSVQRLSNSRIIVQSIAPILMKAGDYSLTTGVEALRAAVGIASISTAVPVDFALVFDAR